MDDAESIRKEDNEDDGDLFMQLIAASIAELKVGNNLENEGPNGVDDLLAEALVLAEEAENDSLLKSCLVAAMLLVDDDRCNFRRTLGCSSRPGLQRQWGLCFFCCSQH